MKHKEPKPTWEEANAYLTFLQKELMRLRDKRTTGVCTYVGVACTKCAYQGCEYKRRLLSLCVRTRARINEIGSCSHEMGCAPRSPRV